MARPAEDNTENAGGKRNKECGVEGEEDWASSCNRSCTVKFGLESCLLEPKQALQGRSRIAPHIQDGYHVNLEKSQNLMALSAKSSMTPQQNNETSMVVEIYCTLLKFGH